MRTLPRKIFDDQDSRVHSFGSVSALEFQIRACEICENGKKRELTAERSGVYWSCTRLIRVPIVDSFFDFSLNTLKRENTHFEGFSCNFSVIRYACEVNAIGNSPLSYGEIFREVTLLYKTV